MIFHQVEAIYYTQKRISDGRVWTEEELGGVDRMPLLESWTNAGMPGLPGLPSGLPEGRPAALLGLQPTRVCKRVLASRCPGLIAPTSESSGLRASDREACGWDRESPGFWAGLLLTAPWMAMRSLGWCHTQPRANILRGHNYTAITADTLVSFSLRLKKKPSPRGILRKAAGSLGKMENADVDVHDRGPRPSPPVHVTLPTAPSCVGLAPSLCPSPFRNDRVCGFSPHSARVFA